LAWSLPWSHCRSAVIATAGPSEALAFQLRAAAARMELDADAQVPAPEPPPPTRAERYAWAMLLARIDEVLPLVCPRCGGAMRILAFVTEAASVRRILEQLGEAATPAPLSPSRAPPWEEFAGMGVVKATSISERPTPMSPGERHAAREGTESARGVHWRAPSMQQARGSCAGCPALGHRSRTLTPRNVSGALKVALALTGAKSRRVLKAARKDERSRSLASWPGARGRKRL
jgi:hypothetical protein